MKPHPRIRKTIKWGGAAVTVLLIAVWVASGWISLIWQSPSRSTRLMIQGGRVGLAEMFAPQPPSAAGLHLAWSPSPFQWTWGRIAGRNFDARWLPLWPPTIVTLLAACAAWRLDVLARRRARAGLCPKCHYDRAGLAPAAPCPECGRPPA